MIDLYYYPTPNTWKITIMAEECGLPYRIIPVNITKGEQFTPSFLQISPNGRVPAIIDHGAQNKPLALFESGAILVYLAEKMGRFLPRDLCGRMNVMQWLFWQVGGIGPMFGQVNHFKKIAEQHIPYAIDRYLKEANRLFGVMERQLAHSQYIAGEYSIADMACWGWCTFHERMEQDLDAIPNVKRWYNAMAQRPAVQRGMSVGAETRDDNEALQPQARKILFGQTATSMTMYSGGNTKTSDNPPG